MSSFEILDEIRDEETGVVAVITKKQKPTGYLGFSFSFFKEFERKPGSQTERTSYLNDRHIGAVRRLINAVEERIEAEKDKLFSKRRSTQ